ELTEKVKKWVTDLCKSGGDKWCLRVPADHNHDPDLIFVEAVRRMNRYASRIAELEARVKELEDANQDMTESYIDRVKELNGRIAELEAENKRLREVLEKVNHAIYSSNMRGTILHLEVRNALNPQPPKEQ